MGRLSVGRRVGLLVLALAMSAAEAALIHPVGVEARTLDGGAMKVRSLQLAQIMGGIDHAPA